MSLIKRIKLKNNLYDIGVTAENISGIIAASKLPTMSGATASSAGAAGIIPAPAEGKQIAFLRGDGTWAIPIDTTYTAATANPKMNGAVAVGTSVKYAREDHIHPSDTTKLNVNNPEAIGSLTLIRNSNSDKIIKASIMKNASDNADYGTQIIDYNTNDLSKYTRLIVRNSTTTAGINKSLYIIDESNEVNYIYGEHNKPTPEAIDAYPTSGGMLSGSISIQRSSGTPSITLLSQEKENVGPARTILYKNAGSSTDNGTSLVDYIWGDGTSANINVRLTLAASYGNSPSNFIRLRYDNGLGTSTTYKLYGEHNKPTPADIGAASFSFAPITNQVVIADGTNGLIKTSGYTIATNVPSTAVFTDTKVNVILNTTTKAYLLATTTTPTSTATGITAIADTGVYLDTAAGSLHTTGNITASKLIGTSGITVEGGYFTIKPYGSYYDSTGEDPGIKFYYNHDNADKRLDTLIADKSISAIKFYGNGSGLTSLDASQITLGTIPSADQLPIVPISKGGTGETTISLGLKALGGLAARGGIAIGDEAFDLDDMLAATDAGTYYVKDANVSTYNNITSKPVGVAFKLFNIQNYNLNWWNQVVFARNSSLPMFRNRPGQDTAWKRWYRMAAIPSTNEVLTDTATWTAVGSTSQPVYVTAGGVVTALNYTIEASVPADAKFTDTTYTNMTGASASAAGKAGLVPAPAAGKQASFLLGNGAWTNILPGSMQIQYAKGTDLTNDVPLIVGTTTDKNLAIGNNAIQSRTNGANSILYLNYNGGAIQMGKAADNSALTLHGILTIDRTGYSYENTARGTGISLLAIKYKNAGTGTYSKTILQAIATGETGTTVDQASIFLGSGGGSLILGAGESAITVQKNNNLNQDENIYLIADSGIKMYANANTATSAKLTATVDSTGIHIEQGYLNIKPYSSTYDTTGTHTGINFYFNHNREGYNPDTLITSYSLQAANFYGVLKGNADTATAITNISKSNFSLTSFFKLNKENISINTGSNLRKANIYNNYIESNGSNLTGSTYRAISLASGRVTSTFTGTAWQLYKDDFINVPIPASANSNLNLVLTIKRHMSYDGTSTNQPQIYIATYNPTTGIISHQVITTSDYGYVRTVYQIDSTVLTNGNLAILIQFRRPTQTLKAFFELDLVSITSNFTFNTIGALTATDHTVQEVT